MSHSDYVHAAIIALTSYESSQHHRDLSAARTHLLNAMQHIITIAKQTPAEPWSKPTWIGRPERDARYIRTMGYLIDMLPIQGINRFPAWRIGLAWYECVALCEHHGWMPTTQATELAPYAPLAQYQPEPHTTLQKRPLLSKIAAPARR